MRIISDNLLLFNILTFLIVGMAWLLTSKVLAIIALILSIIVFIQAVDKIYNDYLLSKKEKNNENNHG